MAPSLLAYLVEDPDGGTVLHVADPERQSDRALAYDVVSAGGFRWDPGGSRLAAVLEKGDLEALVVVRADGKDAARVSGDADLGANSRGHLYWYEWSPSGRFVAFAVANEGEAGSFRAGVHIADVTRDTEWQAATDVVMRDPTDERAAPTMAWSPDGQWLALCDGAGVTLVAPETSAHRRALAPDGEAVDAFLWSPDSSRLALFARAADYTSTVSIYHLPDAACRAVASDIESAGARWASGDCILALPRAGAGPTAVSTWSAGQDFAVLATGEDAVSEYAWMGAQPRLVVVIRQAEGDTLCAVDPNGAGFQRLAPQAGVFHPVPDPRGDRVAFCARGRQLDEQGLYIAIPSSGETMRAHRDMPDSAPLWSPDGTGLLYRVVNPTRQVADAFVCHMNGPSPTVSRVNGPLDARAVAWAPSGAFVAIESAAAKSRVLAVAEATGRPVVVSENVVAWAWPEPPAPERRDENDTGGR